MSDLKSSPIDPSLSPEPATPSTPPRNERANESLPDPSQTSPQSIKSETEPSNENSTVTPDPDEIEKHRKAAQPL